MSEGLVPVSENVVGQTVLSGAPAILSDPRELWLKRRRELITASDVPAIMGEDPREGRSPGDVYLEKVGRRSDFSSIVMEWGSALEPVIARRYEAETGRGVLTPDPYEIVTHPDIPWLGATLDRRTLFSSDHPAPLGSASPIGVLELKMLSGWTGDEDPLPHHVIIQAQVQMGCDRKDWGAVAAFVSQFKPVRTADLLFDKEMLDLMMPTLERFRWHVLHNEPPTDPEWWSEGAVKRMWRRVDAGQGVTLSLEALDVVAKWEAAKDRRDTAKEEAEQHAKFLRLQMGDAEFATISDERILKREFVKETVVPTHTRESHTKLMVRSPKKGKR